LLEEHSLPKQSLPQTICTGKFKENHKLEANFFHAYKDNNICYDSGQAEVTAACPTGWVITGGGLAVSSAAVMYVTTSQPTEIPPNGWFVGVKNMSPVNQIMHAMAMCAHSHRTVTQSIDPMGVH
jgi:hypothetical protein